MGLPLSVLPCSLPGLAHTLHPSWPVTELHLCPQRLVRKVAHELSRPSRSPSLWFFELELGRVKRKKQPLLLCYQGWQEGSLELPVATSLSAWENPVLGKRESSTCAGRHSPAHTLSPSVIASPLTVTGGSKSPFAYMNLRWDSNTHSSQILICHNPLSKGQPLPFLDGEAE